MAIALGAWNGPLPYLRFIHAITDCSEIRIAYLKRNDPLTREQLDSVNSPTRPKTAYEMIADKWNDPDFNPVTRVTKCHHADFTLPIDLCHSKVASLVPADATSIKNRLSTIRVTLLRIIEKWEQSGQGDGGMHEERDASTFGSLEGRSQEALDSRENFLGGSPSWCLYFWEAADMFQLLQATLQRLSDSAIGNVSKRRRRNDNSSVDPESSPDDSGRDTTKLVENMSRFSNIIEELVKTSELDRQATKQQKEEDLIVARKNMETQRLIDKEKQIEHRIAQLRDSIDEFEEKFELTQKSFYERIIARKKDEVMELQRILQDIVTARTSDDK